MSSSVYSNVYFTGYLFVYSYSYSSVSTIGDVCNINSHVSTDLSNDEVSTSSCSCEVTVTIIGYRYGVVTSSKTRYNKGCFTVYNFYFFSNAVYSNVYFTSSLSVYSYSSSSIVTVSDVTNTDVHTWVCFTYNKCSSSVSSIEFIVTIIFDSHVVRSSSKTR